MIRPGSCNFENGSQKLAATLRFLEACCSVCRCKVMADRHLRDIIDQWKTFAFAEASAQHPGSPPYGARRTALSAIVVKQFAPVEMVGQKGGTTGTAMFRSGLCGISLPKLRMKEGMYRTSTSACLFRRRKAWSIIMLTTALWRRFLLSKLLK